MNNARKLGGFDWFLILGTTAVSIASSQEACRAVTPAATEPTPMTQSGWSR